MSVVCVMEKEIQRALKLTSFHYSMPDETLVLREFVFFYINEK